MGDKILYPPERRRYIRFLNEVEGMTIADISRQTGIPVRTIGNWKAREKWSESGSDMSLLEDWTKKSFLEEAAKQGMDLAKVIGIQVDGMTKPTKTTYGRDGDMNVEDDYGTRHKYVKDFFTMSGILGAKEKDDPTDITVNIQINHPGKIEVD